MPLLALPADDLKRMIARRRRLGLDRFDEVWDGVYVLSPLADDTHQELATSLAVAFSNSGLPAGTKVRAGINVSDRVSDWTKNYRCPDVAVFLPGTSALCKDTHWLGGPDFAVEIRSKGDRSRKKLPFYAAVGTRELLLVDRNPWALELYRLDAATLRPAGRATVEGAETIGSEVLNLSFALEAGSDRPVIALRKPDTDQLWRI